MCHNDLYGKYKKTSGYYPSQLHVSQCFLSLDFHLELLGELFEKY